jgi:hypothetical protein
MTYRHFVKVTWQLTKASYCTWCSRVELGLPTSTTEEAVAHMPPGRATTNKMLPDTNSCWRIHNEPVRHEC